MSTRSASFKVRRTRYHISGLCPTAKRSSTFVTDLFSGYKGLRLLHESVRFRSTPPLLQSHQARHNPVFCHHRPRPSRLSPNGRPPEGSSPLSHIKETPTLLAQYRVMIPQVDGTNINWYPVSPDPPTGSVLGVTLENMTGISVDARAYQSCGTTWIDSPEVSQCLPSYSPPHPMVSFQYEPCNKSRSLGQVAAPHTVQFCAPRTSLHGFVDAALSASFPTIIRSSRLYHPAASAQTEEKTSN